MKDNLVVLPGLSAESSPEMMAIVRSVLEAAIAGEMTYLSVEFVVNGKRNSYSVSQAK